MTSGGLDPHTSPYLKANRDRWNELAPVHAAGEFYAAEEFRAGKNKLGSIEREEVGDVSGKTLLHLQCHFGLDTLSWARLGATVTGVDFAASAIEIARSVAGELGLDATFVCSNVYDLPDVLMGQFDIVFTSWGVIGWLPDLGRWGQVIAHFLKPGGTFYIVEGHPFAWVFDDADGATDLRVRYPYFHTGEPMAFDAQGSYADRHAQLTHTREYCWPHSIGDILNPLIAAGLGIEYMHEHKTIARKLFPFMSQDEAGMWRLNDHADSVPLSFSIKATRPEGRGTQINADESG